MPAKRKWSERSRRSRTLIVAAGVVEVVLPVATLIDVKRRPADRIKGPKRMWTALAFINILGQIAYFAFGRRQRSAGVESADMERALSSGRGRSARMRRVGVGVSRWGTPR